MASAMTLFRRFLPFARNGREHKAFTFPAEQQSSWVFFAPNGESIPPPSSKQSTGLLSSSVIAAALQWEMRTFPEAPPVVQKQQDGNLWETVQGHAMTRLLRAPNPFYGGRVLWMATVMDLAFGEAFWIKIRDGFGEPVQLWWAPRALMTPKWPDDGSVFISHYEYNVAGRILPLSPDDVVHFRFGMDPANIRRGFSQLAAVVREVYVDQEAANFTAAILKNLGIIGVVISPAEASGPPMGEQDVKDVKSYVMSHFTGGHRGDPLVFSRPTKLEAMQYNLQGFDVGPIRDIAEERVCAALGIPAAVIGFGTGLQQTKVGATMREMVQLAWRGAIMPTQAIVADELDRSLLPEFQSNTNLFRTDFDTTKVRALWEDETQKTDRITRAIGGGVIQVAEGRRDLGYPAGPEHEVFYRPNNVVAVKAPGDEPPQPPAPPAPKAPPAAEPAPGEPNPGEPPPEAKDDELELEALQADYDEAKGWVTIHGNHVLLDEDGGDGGGGGGAGRERTPIPASSHPTGRMAPKVWRRARGPGKRATWFGKPVTIVARLGQWNVMIRTPSGRHIVVSPRDLVPSKD